MAKIYHLSHCVKIAAIAATLQSGAMAMQSEAPELQHKRYSYSSVSYLTKLAVGALIFSGRHVDAFYSPKNSLTAAKNFVTPPLTPYINRYTYINPQSDSSCSWIALYSAVTYPSNDPNDDDDEHPMSQKEILKQYFSKIPERFKNSADAKILFDESLKKAEEKSIQDQLDVGLCLINGVGPTQDIEKGFVWIIRAARRGLPEAKQLADTVKDKYYAKNPDKFISLLKKSNQNQALKNLETNRLINEITRAREEKEKKEQQEKKKKIG